MKILLGLLLSFNAFASGQYECTKDNGFLGMGYVSSLISGSGIDAPQKFDYPSNDERFHYEQSTITGANGNPVYDSKGYVVTDVTTVANTTDITLNLVSTKDIDVFVCERTPVPNKNCFPKSAFPQQTQQGILQSLQKIKVVGNIQLISGVGTNVLVHSRSFASQVAYPTNSSGSQLYVIPGPPARTFEEFIFPQQATRSQKYYCKGSLPAISGEFSQEFRDNMPQIIDDTAPSSATQQ
jgi:hypothetical protein